MINVDTDMIIPKQYLKTIKRTGLGKGLFAEKRCRDDGSENPDFVLNKPAYRKAKILVAGERGANATLSIDLEKQEIRGPDGGMVRFEIEPHRKHALLHGLDDIGLTVRKQDKIENFERQAKAAR